MTTCPQCGRLADDEFVCAECGAFLAAERDEEPAGDVPVRRVALLAILVCLLGVGAAAVLLRSNDVKGTGALEPGVSVSLSSAPLGTTGFSSAPGEPASSLASSVSLPSTTATGTAASSSSSSSSPSRSTSATSTTTSSAAPQPSASRTPSTSASSTQPSSPRPTTSTPPSTPPPTPPTVGLSRGGSCGPHCYALVVTLHNFTAGSHTVVCWSGHEGQFGSYSTSETTSSRCNASHPHDTVWVVVDGHRSNNLTL